MVSTKHRRILLVFIAAIACNSGHAQTVTAQTPLREIQIPGKTIRVPGGSFGESPVVQKLCSPDSNRPAIRDQTGQNYLREEDFRQVMAQGQRIAQVSDQWARALGVTTLWQNQIPNDGNNDKTFRIRLSKEQIDATDWGRRKPPEPAPANPVISPLQRDLDHNFAVLDAVQAEIETAAQSYIADINTLQINAIHQIASQAPASELPALMRQLDRFVTDNLVCINERKMGRHLMTQLVEYGWPIVNLRQPRVPAWHTQVLRARQTNEEFNAAFAKIAAQAIQQRRADLVSQLAVAKTNEDLTKLMATNFGDGRFYALAMKDEQLNQAISVRSSFLLAEMARLAREAEERRIAANKARILAALKSNGRPQLADIQALVTKGSMEMTARERGQPVVTRSDKGYEMLLDFFGTPMKQADVDIQVSSLACEPRDGGQWCSYEESFQSRHFAPLLTDAPIRVQPVTTSRASGMFRWTPDGLVVVDGKGPVVTYLGRGASSGQSSSGRSQRAGADYDEYLENRADWIRRQQEDARQAQRTWSITQ